MSPYETLLREARGRPFAAIVGWPVEHSRSPALHGFWLKQHGIDGHYGRLPVEPKRAALEELIAFLKRTPNARGCNLTLPHKIDIMPLLDRIDPLAKHIGAVNTVIKQPDGTLEGRNSDGFGFLEALKQGAPGWQAAAGPVVVLGAGGAARAVVATLVGAGVPELRLINRTQKSAIDLGVAFTPNDGRRIAIERWDERDDAARRRDLAGEHDVARHEGPAAARDRRRPPAGQRRGRRHRLCAAGDPPAGRRARARPALHRRARHAAAPGPAGLRGVVRPEGGRQRRTAPSRRG